MDINAITDAISIKLQSAFGEDYKKHTEEVPQGFKAPAFFIQFLSLEHMQQIGRRWKVNTLFNVQYFPRKGASESANMALRVQQALSVITLQNGALMRATRANSEVIDGIGHNFMKFNFFLQEAEVTPFMESLKINSTKKG